MNPHKGLVLDANILIRAVLGRQVFELLIKYYQTVTFYCPEECFEDARKYLPELCAKRRLDPSAALATLDELEIVVELVSRNVYEPYEEIALERVGIRDPNDWPVAALCLMLDLPVWTQDQDFFGSGIATWTTDRVEIYLRT